MEQIKKKRILVFDLLKIFAILVIFAHHIVMDMYVVHPMYNFKFVENILIRANINIVMVAVAIFIMISGATLSISKRDETVVGFYKKRLTRVLIPFYISYIIYFVIKVLNNKTFRIFGGVPKWRFIFTICGIDEYIAANGERTFSLGIGEWFLGCIIFCYIAYPLLKKIHKYNKYILFIIMTAFYIWFNINYDSFGFKIVSHMNFFSQIYNFYLGILLVEEKIFEKSKWHFLIVTIPILLYLYFYNGILQIPDNFKTTIFTFSLIISVILLNEFLKSNDYLMKVINIFNKISLEIYLVHHFIIYQIDYMLSYRRLNGISALFIIVIDFVLTILVAFAVEFLSRKTQLSMQKCHNK